jgi:predicted metal-dependent phosphoesterase TrpH
MNLHFSPVDHDRLGRDYATVDTHLHSKYSMDCATKPAIIYKAAKKKHLGIALTDHNEIKGVKALAEHKDLFLIPGIEVTSKELKDVLVYFDTVRDLESFYLREIKPKKLRLRRLRMNKVNRPFADILESARDFNATVVLPHPFGIKNTYEFLSTPEHAHLLKHVHAIEAANGTLSRKANMAAYGWAQLLRKPITGGSDSHIRWSVGCFVTAAYDHSPSAFLAQVRAGNTQVFGVEQRTRLKLATNFAMLKNKLLKNKKIPAPKTRVETGKNP